MKKYDARSVLAENRAVGRAISERWENLEGGMIDGYDKPVNWLAGIGESDHQTRHLVSQLLENTYNEIRKMHESTRTLAVGSYEKIVFPLIRFAYANLIAADLVSVTPLAAPHGLLFYYDIVYGSSKGSISKGNKMYDSRQGPASDFHYSDEVVEGEVIGTGNGALTEFTNTLSFSPIRPGTVVVTDGTQVLSDNGNGVLIGDVGGGANTVNYQTGAIAVSFAGAPDAADAIEVNFEFNLEANAGIPEVDIQLTSSPVNVRKYALRANWSVEAMQDAQAYHNIDLEADIIKTMANEINKETNYKIIRHIRDVASAGSVTWDRTPPSGVQWVLHRESFYDILIQLGNAIFTSTQRFDGNWIVAGVDVCTVIETLSRFKPTGKTASDTAGVRKIGELGRFTIYKDPTYTTTDFLMGHKGSSILETGYIWAPYLGLFTTPVYTLDDMVSRVAMMQRAGQKVVNSRMYATGSITQTGGPFG